ncbi:MAG: Alpha/beta hydrolase family [Cyanobacteria bacterium RYN_339]|nr:Alpha/beta hydrolase family [Cyanobacteria bacterium RYN_339]
MRKLAFALATLLTACGGTRPLAPAPAAAPVQAESLRDAYLDATSKLGVRFALHHERRRPLAAPTVPYDDVHFASEDGLRLAAWYVPAAVPTHKTVVLVHGHADSRYAFLRDGQLAMLQPAYNVLALDLRNNGDSDGTVTSFGLYEWRDVVAAVKYAEDRGAQDVALYGMSMGAVTCLNALERLPAVKAVLLDCPYASARAAFVGFAAAAWEPNPVLVGQAILARANKELGADMADAEGLKHIAAVGNRPLWMVHGLADDLIAPDESRALFALAPTPVKELWLVPGAGHGQSVNVARAAYATRLQAFLAAHF